MTRHESSDRAAAHAALDQALLDVRRLWMHPRLLRLFSERIGTDVELATLRTLRAIEAAGDDEVGVGDLAAALVVDASTASRLVDQAVAEGYVTRRGCARDRRRTNLALTSDGRRMLERAATVRGELLGRATRDWADEELATLAGLLARLPGDLRALVDEERGS